MADQQRAGEMRTGDVQFCHGCGDPDPANYSTLEHVRYCDDCVKGYADARTDVSDIEETCT